MVTGCFTTGSGGLAVGAQTGIPFASAQTSVWLGGTPVIAKLEQLGSTMVNDGGGAGVVMSSVKLCTASGGTPLVAANCSAKLPASVAVPASTPVAALNVIPP